MQAAALLGLLRLASPALPVGGFSYSEALEAAVDGGLVHDGASAAQWLSDQLHLAQARSDLPLVAEGDLVAFRSAGAYGAVMASEYNTRPLIPEVLVHGDHFAVIRERPTFDEILNRDTIPEWL